MEGCDLSCLFAKHLSVREGKIGIAQGGKITAADWALPHISIFVFRMPSMRSWSCGVQTYTPMQR